MHKTKPSYQSTFCLKRWLQNCTNYRPKTSFPKNKLYFPHTKIVWPPGCSILLLCEVMTGPYLGCYVIIGVSMDGIKCGTLGSSRMSIDAHTQTKREAFLRQMTLCEAFSQISINVLVAWCRKQCWSASRACPHSFCPKHIFVALKIIAIFREFYFFRNKAKNTGRFRKTAGRKAKCGISRMIAGWLTPMCYETKARIKMAD